MRLNVVTITLPLVCLGLFGGTASAQTVSFGANQPTVKKGTITAVGTFDCGMGNTVYSVKLTVVGPAGNPGKKDVEFTPPDPLQAGPWGEIGITGLSPGLYDVYVELYYQNVFGMIFKTKEVNAPANPYNVP